MRERAARDRITARKSADVSFRRSRWELAETTPDGVSYGSRWSERQRATTGTADMPDFSTAAAVAEEIHAAWYLIRDPSGVGETRAPNYRWSLASLGPPATVRDASGVLRETSQVCQSIAV